MRAGGSTETARRILEREPTDGSVYLVRPSDRQLFAFTQASRESSGPTVRVLAPHESLVGLRSDFPAASRAAEAVDCEELAFREADPPAAGVLAVGSERVYAPLVADGDSTHLAGTGSFQSVARAACERWWASATPFDLRTPPLARLRETTLDRFDAAVWDDYETTLTAATRLRDRTAFDATAAGVLVGARHGLSQRAVARWAEHAGVASRGTVSRTKRELESDGVVTAEPTASSGRHRLALTDEYAAMADDHGLAELVVRIVT